MAVVVVVGDRKTNQDGILNGSGWRAPVKDTGECRSGDLR